jgi:hypothetical protein
VSQELAKHAQTFVEEQLNMLEGEMSAQEKAVTEKVTQHLHEQCVLRLSTRQRFLCCVSALHHCRYQQEFQKISEQHSSNMEALRQAHEAEMAAALVREEANLMQAIRPSCCNKKISHHNDFHR